MQYPKMLRSVHALPASLYLLTAFSHAQVSAPSIPFKQDTQGLAEQSVSTFVVTLVLLCITVAALIYLRNYLAKKTGRTFLKSSSIQLKERTRISPQLTMYVVTYRDKEILLAQTANTVVPVSEYPVQPPHS